MGDALALLIGGPAAAYVVVFAIALAWLLQIFVALSTAMSPS